MTNMDTVTFSDITGLKLLRPHELFLNMVGVFPTSNQGKSCMFMTTLFGAILSLYTVIQCCFTLQAIPDVFQSQNFARLALGINYLSVSVSCLHKYYLLKTKRSIFEKLGTWLVYVKVQHQTEQVKSHIAVKVAEFANRSFYISCMAALISWVSWPFIQRSGPSVPSTLPRSLDTFLICAQTIDFMFFLAIIVYTACAVGNMLGVLCTEIKYVSDCMQQLEYNQENPKDYLNKMAECVEKHIQNHRILLDIGRIQSGMFAYQVFITISISCAFIFGILKKGVLQKAIYYVLPLACASIPEFALMCWLGEQITYEFESLHWSIYNNNWYEAPPTVRKQLRIILEVTKKPIFLSGAKVFKASLRTFVEAMKQSFSLYTLLKAMTGED